jgi:hypothetical protein
MSGSDNPKKYTITFWDGSKELAHNRDQAVDVVKKGLSGWMNPDDRISWYKSEETLDLPDMAVVVTFCGEDTDASARITIT